MTTEKFTVIPKKMNPDMQEALWTAITRHGTANLEYWIEELYNDIIKEAIRQNEEEVIVLQYSPVPDEWHDCDQQMYDRALKFGYGRRELKVIKESW